MVESRSAAEQAWKRIDRLRSEIDAALARCVLAPTDPSSTSFLPGDCPERLRAAMEYSLLAGGKRLRPLLLLLACEACGGKASIAMPAACAMEMVHTYSLIHDDLPAMDDDALRRGRATCHVQFDEATAILAGDALLTQAFALLASLDCPADVRNACVFDLAMAAGGNGMVGGQMADLAAEGRFQNTAGPPDTSGVRAEPEFADNAVEQLQSIHRRKTGALMTSSLTIGGRLAFASESAMISLRTYGNSVGLAFQIADDLLDVLGDEVRMGKGVRKDADVGKLTYPGLLGAAESRRRAEELVATAIDAVSGLEPGGGPLTTIARFILERDH